MSSFFKQILYVPFYNLLIFFAWLTGGSVGWAIVLVTIVIRILLLPPSLKAAKATTKMQALQPQLNEIKEKHKGDAKKQNEETMRLYKEAGASPLGCCGPMIIQLVVIFILYRVFFIGFDTANYNLLYAFTPRPETLNNFFLGFDMSKPDLWILPILAGLTQLVLSLMTMPKRDPKAKRDPAQAMNRQMAFLFPIMTIFIGRSLQSGLVIYWIITTVFSIGQQFYVNKVIRKDAPVILPSKTEEIESVREEPKAEGKETKKDVVSKITQGRLNRQDKKKGVEVTIRKKK